jgi:hypothetical protein
VKTIIIIVLAIYGAAATFAFWTKFDEVRDYKAGYANMVDIVKDQDAQEKIITSQRDSLAFEIRATRRQGFIDGKIDSMPELMKALKDKADSSLHIKLFLTDSGASSQEGWRKPSTWTQ